MPLLTSTTGRQKFRGMQGANSAPSFTWHHLAIHAILSLKCVKLRCELPDGHGVSPEGAATSSYFGMYSQHLNSDSLLSGKMEQQNMEVLGTEIVESNQGIDEL